MHEEALEALGIIDDLLGQLSLDRKGHVHVQKNVDCIRRALEQNGGTNEQGES